MTTLPPDPWNVLGLERSADKTEIRKAYRKLVLSCHPDKVQDAALKALKQDEFQKVQQAYELLNDDTELAKYEERVKLQEMKRQAEQQAALRSKNMPNTSASRTPPRSATYFEIRVAEPRSRPSPSYPVSSTKIYTTGGRTKSYENVDYRSSDDEYRRRREREREREPSSGKSMRRDDEVRESRRRDRDERRKEEDLAEERRRDKEAKEARDRERRQRDERRSREKRSATEDKSRKKGPSSPYVEGYPEEEVYVALKGERKKVPSSSSSKKIEEVREKSSSRRERERGESPRAVVDIEEKTDRLREAAASYIERHRKPVSTKAPMPMLGRSATMPTQYAPPPPRVDDFDEPRRSSARTTTRRPSDPQELQRRSKETLYQTLHKSKEKIDARPVSPPPSSDRGAPPAPLRAHTMPVVAEPDPSPRYADMSSRRTAQAVKPRISKAPTWSPGVGDPREAVFNEYVVEEEEIPRRHRSARHEVVEEPYLRQPLRRETSYKVSADRKTTSKVEVYDDIPYGYDDRRGPSRRTASYAMYEEPNQFVETDRPYYYENHLPYKVKTSKPVTPEDIQYAYYQQPSRPIYSQS